MFRLSGRTHDPADIRRAATLEIVELISVYTGSSARTIKTLAYPVIIALVRAEVDVLMPVRPTIQGVTYTAALRANIDARLPLLMNARRA